MTQADVANLIPDGLARRAWIRAGMPTDLALVARLVTEARQGAVYRSQSTPVLRRRRPATLTSTT